MICMSYLTNCILVLLCNASIKCVLSVITMYAGEVTHWNRMCEDDQDECSEERGESRKERKKQAKREHRVHISSPSPEKQTNKKKKKKKKKENSKLVCKVFPKQKTEYLRKLLLKIIDHLLQNQFISMQKIVSCPNYYHPITSLYSYHS